MFIFAVLYRGVEQLVARRAHNPEVGGSSPPPATKQDNSFGLSLFFIPYTPHRTHCKADFGFIRFLRLSQPVSIRRSGHCA